jgi:hypothetical protein
VCRSPFAALPAAPTSCRERSPLVGSETWGGIDRGAHVRALSSSLLLDGALGAGSALPPSRCSSVGGPAAIVRALLPLVIGCNPPILLLDIVELAILCGSMLAALLRAYPHAQTCAPARKRGAERLARGRQAGSMMLE